MDVIFLLIACLFFSLQFIFQKLFTQRTAGGLSVCLWNQIVCCIASILLLLLQAENLLRTISGPAFLYALLYAASTMICSVATIMAMDCGNIAIVSMFCLAGGMIIPYIYGILVLDENEGPGKWLGIAVLCAALLPPVLQKKKCAAEYRKTKMHFIGYCTLVFLTNGFISVFSKMHQISAHAISEDSFIFLAALLRCSASLGMLLCLAARRHARGERHALRHVFWEIGKKPMNHRLFLLLIVLTGAYSVCNTLGNLFSLQCMKTMDSSIQFPLLSAIVIVLTALLGRICFAEKITRQTTYSLLLSTVGILLLIGS